MGRRRRHRQGVSEGIGDDAPVGSDAARGDMLEPTYVTVHDGPWNAESDAPALALEGLRPWEEIHGPAILLEDADRTNGADGLIPDSHDPQQMDLTRDALDALAVQDAEKLTLVLESEDERPVLVLEPEPPIEVQAELPLVIETATAIAEPEATPPEPETVTEPAALPPPLDPAEQLYQDARAAAAEGRPADARELYQRLLVERPAHVGARNNLAMLLESHGDQPGALGHYDRALDIEAENTTLLANRGALLCAMGRYSAAERDLKKALRIDPSHPEALFHIGVVMTKKGLWAEAVPQLRRTVELDPARGAAYFYLGEALNHVDDLYGAMAAYQRASELMPTHPRALYGLGIVYDRLGRPEDAARMYRRSREVGRR